MVDRVSHILYMWRMGKGRAKSAKSRHQTFRIDPELKRLADELVDIHGTGSLSDYIRGLIILDGVLTKVEDFSYSGEVPDWLFMRYPEEWIKHALPKLLQLRNMLGHPQDIQKLVKNLKEEIDREASSRNNPVHRQT